MPSPKLPTFKQAQEAIFQILRAKGWNVAAGLKTPHATSPDGRLRLWFKPPAIHYTSPGMGRRHDAGDARTVYDGLDIRKIEPAKLVDWLAKTYG